MKAIVLRISVVFELDKIKKGVSGLSLRDKAISEAMQVAPGKGWKYESDAALDDKYYEIRLFQFLKSPKVEPLTHSKYT